MSVTNSILEASHSGIVLEFNDGQVDSLVDELYEKRIIGEGEKAVIQGADQEATKASRLTNIIRQVVQRSPSCFGKLTSILQGRCTNLDVSTISKEKEVTRIEFKASASKLKLECKFLLASIKI